MENIISAPHIESPIGLSLVINDLQEDIEYKSMRIKIDDYDWVYVERDETRPSRSTKAVFTNLDDTKLYYSYGEIMLDDYWDVIHSPKFQPQKRQLTVRMFNLGGEGLYPGGLMPSPISQIKIGVG